jgi:hypothetical protein
MDNQELIKLIHQLSDKIDSIQRNEFHFHIEKVNVEHLRLEELAYHLDTIDIKELSGMMNLGNSFSPNLDIVKSLSKKSKEKQGHKEQNSGGKKGKRKEPVLSVVINGKEVLSE